MENIFEKSSTSVKILVGPCVASIEERIKSGKRLYVVVVCDAYGHSTEAEYSTRAAARSARRASHTYRKSY